MFMLHRTSRGIKRSAFVLWAEGPVQKVSYILPQKLRVTRCRRRRLKGYALQVRCKQDWDRGFILLLPQAAVLLGSDAGSDVVKPTSSFVIQNLHVVSDVWGTLLERDLQFAQRPHMGNLKKERDLISAWTNGIAQHQFAGG